VSYGWQAMRRLSRRSREAAKADSPASQARDHSKSHGTHRIQLTPSLAAGRKSALSPPRILGRIIRRANEDLATVL
jgi:hypothetical protein